MNLSRKTATRLLADAFAQAGLLTAEESNQFQEMLIASSYSDQDIFLGVEMMHVLTHFKTDKKG